MTQERVLEMYQKFMSLGKVKGTEEVKSENIVSKVATMELSVNVPDTLLSLGVATTQAEAEEFIVQVIAGTQMAVLLGKVDATEAMYDLLKIGFQLGLFAGESPRATN